jgi:hypothetical protein
MPAVVGGSAAWAEVTFFIAVFSFLLRGRTRSPDLISSSNTTELGEARAQFRPTIAPIAPFPIPIVVDWNAWRVSDGTRGQAASALRGPSDGIHHAFRSESYANFRQTSELYRDRWRHLGEQWKASVIRQIATLGSEPARRLSGRECPFSLFRLLDANGQPTTKLSRPECSCEGPLRLEVCRLSRAYRTSAFASCRPETAIPLPASHCRFAPIAAGPWPARPFSKADTMSAKRFRQLWVDS